jgi:hypothetical protein
VNKGFSRLFLLVACSVTQPVLAQTPRNQEFFKKNYAVNPLSSSSKGTSEGYKDKGLSHKRDTNYNHNKETPVKEGFVGVDTTPEIKESHSSVLQKVVGTPTPIHSFGAIINCHDEKHCAKNFNTLFSLVENFNYKLSDVYLIANPLKDRIPLENDGSLQSQQRALELTQALLVKNKPPEGYQIGTSPSWIVETPKDIIVLEGIETIERYLDKSGKFLYPDIPKSNESPKEDKSLQPRK